MVSRLTDHRFYPPTLTIPESEVFTVLLCPFKRNVNCLKARCHRPLPQQKAHSRECTPRLYETLHMHQLTYMSRPKHAYIPQR